MIIVELNTDKYFSKDALDNILKNLFSEKETKPFENIIVVGKELFAYLECDKIKKILTVEK